MAEFGVDVCAWRAAGVATKLIAGMHNGKDDLFTTTPEKYVDECFKKCTSGVHHGWVRHEILGLIVDNVSDIVPWFGSFAMNKVCELFVGKTK